MSSRDPSLAPAYAMIEQLSPPAVLELAQALHAKLNAPAGAAARRITELRFLARLLDETPQLPERLPYIARQTYDTRRAERPPGPPRSETLVQRYGSWARACHAAWGLLDDGRSIGPGQPWPRPPRSPRTHTEQAAIKSVRNCALAFGRIPSSTEYHNWAMETRAARRAVGRDASDIVPYNRVIQLLAADRGDRQGWELTTQRVFGESRSQAIHGAATRHAHHNQEVQHDA